MRFAWVKMLNYEGSKGPRLEILKSFNYHTFQEES